MSDQDIIHFIYIILPLKEQFERDPYGLKQTDLDLFSDGSRIDLLSKKKRLLEPF